MAEINIEDLIKLIKEQKNYFTKLEKGTDANEALYIKFSKEIHKNIKSDNYETIDGNEIILDKTKDGKIYGIEII